MADSTNGFPILRQDLTNGTGSSQAGQLFAKSYTILTTANQDLDLAGVLTNGFGETITFAALKTVVVAIDTPDGSKEVRFGPQGVTNPMQLWFSATTAGFYDRIFDFFVQTNEWTGWAVTGGSADTIRINNPTGSSVTVHVVLIGTI